MYYYSKVSNYRLSSCHIDIQNLFLEVLLTYDHSVLCGHRGREEQEKAFDEGKTTLHYPFSKHNKYPSMAIDVAPYPIDWKDIRRFYHFAGYVQRVALELKEKGLITHDIRWGGDWDNNHIFSDQKFNDLVHVELIGE